MRLRCIFSVPVVLAMTCAAASAAPITVTTVGVVTTAFLLEGFVQEGDTLITTFTINDPSSAIDLSPDPQGGHYVFATTPLTFVTVGQNIGTFTSTGLELRLFNDPNPFERDDYSFSSVGAVTTSFMNPLPNAPKASQLLWSASDIGIIESDALDLSPEAFSALQFAGFNIGFVPNFDRDCCAVAYGQTLSALSTAPPRATTVPEPSSSALLLIGASVAGMCLRRKRT